MSLPPFGRAVAIHTISGQDGDLLALAAIELWAGRVTLLGTHALQQRPACPLPADVLWIAWDACLTSECLLRLGWPVPRRWLDLRTEHRRARNRTVARTRERDMPVEDPSLWDALEAHGGDAPNWLTIEAAERAGPVEHAGVALGTLLCLLAALASASRLRHPVGVLRAALRGSYVAALARVIGTPLDPVLAPAYVRHRSELLRRIITDNPEARTVFNRRGTLDERKVAVWIKSLRIDWPREHGRLQVDGDTIRDMARTHPRHRDALDWLHGLNTLASVLRAPPIHLDADGFNRPPLNPFGSKTGRNQPSRSIWGECAALRSLIWVPRGFTFLYLDFAGQEVGIAAALSGDESLAATYHAADMYTDFGIRAGILPATATRQTHPRERDRLKVVLLGRQYGMGARTIATRLGVTLDGAQSLLDAHRGLYPRLDRWMEGVVRRAATRGWIETRLGWRLEIPGPEFNERMLGNFAIQAHGAEILRLALLRVIGADVSVCAPIHDAIAVCCETVDVDKVTHTVRRCMIQAGAEVLGGLKLKVDAKRVDGPGRYYDGRSPHVWLRVLAALEDIEPGILAGAGTSLEIERRNLEASR